MITQEDMRKARAALDVIGKRIVTALSCETPSVGPCTRCREAAMLDMVEYLRFYGYHVTVTDPCTGRRAFPKKAARKKTRARAA